MTEQTRTLTRVGPAIGRAGGDDDGSAGMAQVATGLYAERLPVVGRTVASVRESFADRLDIDPQSIAVLDGRRLADESTTIAPGQHLAFVRFAGEKGRGA